MTGLAVQRQWLNIIFFQEFLNDPASLASQINIQLQSQSIQVSDQHNTDNYSSVQIYSAKIHIEAELSGLRYIMHNHPWISSLSGILANIAVLTTICLISWTRLFSREEELLELDPRTRLGREERKDKISEIETLTDNFVSQIPLDKFDSFIKGN